MKIIRVTKENLEGEHICCAISSNKDCQVVAKKRWMSRQLEEGLIFEKADVRGKAFIEYIPAEKAWCPVDAPGYMFINCLWVSGQFKGKGIANELLSSCIENSKSEGKQGIVIISSAKKRPFLADPTFFKYKGFTVADEANPYFTLMYLPFSETTLKPKFKTCAKKGMIKEKGVVIYYSAQCPFTAKYVPLAKQVVTSKGIAFKAIEYRSANEAQVAAVPSTSYSLFYNGRFITNEILSEKRLEKLLEE